MEELPSHALVLFKGKAACITSCGEKIFINTADNQELKVRPKDLALLHPGPVDSLHQVIHSAPAAEVDVAWELLAGHQVVLSELCELACGEYTPATAWRLWQEVQKGEKFQGTPEAIDVFDAEYLQAVQARWEAKEARKQAWQRCVERCRQQQPLADEDRDFMRAVEDCALERSSQCALLVALGRRESPENAHNLLLERGYWAPGYVPYAERLGLPQAAPEAPVPALPQEPRRDLTYLEAFAIDDADSSDPDDAISLEGERLWVHVADPTAVTPLDSELDAISRQRGGNLYLPHKTIPMLPESLTQGFALGLQETSPAFSFALTLNHHGQPRLEDWGPSWVKVKRLSYAEAQHTLHQSPLADMYAWAQQFQQWRLAQGAVELLLPEVKVRVNSQEEDIRIESLPRIASRVLVQESMLACGTALGQWAAENAIPLPFSGQPPARQEVPASLEGLAKDWAKRKTMAPSSKSTSPQPHHGMGLPAYVQATSPLRRYADLLTHQQLRRIHAGQAPLTAETIMHRLGNTEDVARQLRRAENLATRHWILRYLQLHPQWQGEAVLVEEQARRNRVLVPQLGLDFGMSTVPADSQLNSRFQVQAQDIRLPYLEVRLVPV